MTHITAAARDSKVSEGGRTPAAHGQTCREGDDWRTRYNRRTIAMQGKKHSRELADSILFGIEPESALVKRTIMILNRDKLGTPIAVIKGYHTVLSVNHSGPDITVRVH